MIGPFLWEMPDFKSHGFVLWASLYFIIFCNSLYRGVYIFNISDNRKCHTGSGLDLPPVRLSVTMTTGCRLLCICDAACDASIDWGHVLGSGLEGLGLIYLTLYYYIDFISSCYFLCWNVKIWRITYLNVPPFSTCVVTLDSQSFHPGQSQT